MTKVSTAPSYPVSIFLGGDAHTAHEACREFCMEGLCVTVTPTDYVYTGGAESGVIVGLINYPRFPKEPHEIEATARRLATFLMDRLHQLSCTIQTPDHTDWISNRPD